MHSWLYSYLHVSTHAPVQYTLHVTITCKRRNYQFVLFLHFLFFFFLFLWVMQIVKWWFCAEWLHAYLHECLPTCDCSPNTQVSSRDWSGKECLNEYELSKYIDFNFGLVNLVFRHANGRLSAGIQMRNRGYIGNSAYIRGRHMAKWVRLKICDVHICTHLHTYVAVNSYWGVSIHKRQK